MDEKSRLTIPVEIIETKKISEFVYLVNKGTDGRFLTRIYYRKPKIRTAVRVALRKAHGGLRVTIIKSIKEKSTSFYYDDQVMVVDKGNYIEILPWPVM